MSDWKGNVKYCIIMPIMIPNLEIQRYSKEREEYYKILFSQEDIKVHFEKFLFNMNIYPDLKYFKLGHHGTIYKGAKIVDSFLSNSSNKKKWWSKFKKLPKGTFFQTLEFDSYLEYVWFKTIYPNGGGASVSLILNVTDSDGNTFKSHEEFERINKNISGELPFNVYIHGGETGSIGRSEHGDAHFELKELNTNKTFSKIYIPTLEVWTKSNIKKKLNILNSFDGRDLNKKEKVKF